MVIAKVYIELNKEMGTYQVADKLIKCKQKDLIILQNLTDYLRGTGFYFELRFTSHFSVCLRSCLSTSLTVNVERKGNWRMKHDYPNRFSGATKCDPKHTRQNICFSNSPKYPYFNYYRRKKL